MFKSCLIATKEVLFRIIMSRGAEHDSNAFENSSLYKFMMENCKYYEEKGFYIVADSAYGVKSFLLTPYDNALNGTPEDNFNYFHSSTRICVECDFGEIDLHWGILWRPLRFKLEKIIRVIDACMRLHNFIIDFCLNNELPTTSEYIDRKIFDEDCRRFLASSIDTTYFGIQGGEDGVKMNAYGKIFSGGKPFPEDLISNKKGEKLRNFLCNEIKRRKNLRQIANCYRKNDRMYEM